MMMMTATTASQLNSLNSSSPSETTCNICKRLLYPFEEVLRCRICYGAYHWRCLKPQRASRYGQNENYICANCSDGGTTPTTTTTTNSSYRSSNGLNQTESFETNERDLNDMALRRPSEDSFRHYENTPSISTMKTIQRTEFDDYSSPPPPPLQTNGNHYQHQNSHYSDDNRFIRRIEQENGIESDDENQRRTMFQANYQYTPLKDYAATRNHRTNNDYLPPPPPSLPPLLTNSYQNSPTDNATPQPTSRYGGGLHYSDHGYDPTVNRLVEIPPTSPTQQNHFISTTSLTINEKPLHRQQQRPPYSPPMREIDSPSLRYPSQSQQHIDRQSTAGSDSGIVTIASTSQPPHPVDENHVVEKKITNLVQQLGKQLENDAQKLNEKLELKLKNLENMIHQQTYIIRKQDEVIEQLKNQIHQIENERDHFRQQLIVHEQREQNEMKRSIPTNPANNQYMKQEIIIPEQEKPIEKKYYNTSPLMNDSNKASTKKTPAPRVENQGSNIYERPEPTTVKLIQHVPIGRERSGSDYSSTSSSSSSSSSPSSSPSPASSAPSAPSTAGKLVASVPIAQPPAASNRLDNIIHQSHTKDRSDPSTQNYNLAPVRTQNPQLYSLEQRIISSIHHEDNSAKDDTSVLQHKRSKSTSSSTSSSKSLPGPSAETPHRPSTTTTTTTTQNRNPNKYPSFESLQPPYQNDPNPKMSTKAASLQFGVKPVREETGSSSTALEDSMQPDIQSSVVVKGWLRKQNRESFLKRIERFYCVLKNNVLLMHRHNYDQTPHKAINLKGAKVLYYDDPKFGPSLELTWNTRSNHPKHYHLYAPNPQEAEQWSNGIQTAIYSFENKNNWQQYRMNI